MSDPCAFTNTNAMAHDEFDHDLTGEGFGPIVSDASTTTTVGSTASAAWDPAVGHVCQGSFRLTGVFKGYATSEVALANMVFPSANWSGAKALHAWVKVDPATAPLSGLQIFVVSGSEFRFAAAYDGMAFALGTWNELIINLAPSGAVDPTSVYRVGAMMFLKDAGSAGIPATPPTTSVWMDDVWVEK
jgi:hypothetical protein